MFNNVLKLLSGNALGQVIQMVSLLFLATLYKTSEFGKLGNVQAITTISVVVFTLQLQHTIPISMKKGEAISKAKTVLQIITIAFLIFFCASLLISTEYVYASIYALILALPTVLNNLLIYFSKFAILAHTYIVRAILIVALQFAFYYLHIPNGLLFATITGELLSVIYILFINKFWSLFKFKINFTAIKSIIIEWESFALYGTVQEFLSVMVYSLPVIMYVNKFGESVGGQFSMAYKITFAPIVLLSSSLAQVLTHKFGKENDYSIIRKIIWFDKRLFIVALLLIISVFFVADSGITILDGKWNVAIQLVPYLLLNAFFFLFAVPFRLALRVLKRNVDILKIEIATVAGLGVIFFFFDYNIVFFTIIITAISLLQNILLIFSYFHYKKLTNIF